MKRTSRRLFVYCGMFTILLITFFILNPNFQSSKKTQNKIVFGTIVKSTYASKYFENPVEIIFYNHGKKTIISKQDTLYKQILKLTNDRFTGKKFSMSYNGLNEDAIDKLNNSEISIEFIYSKEFETKYIMLNNQVIAKKYVKLYMPLSGSYSKDFYLIKSDGSRIVEPLEGLGSSKDLIEALLGK